LYFLFRCKPIKFFPSSIPGTLTVEEVYKDRDQFASLVREVAAPDVGRMGIEILSFTIKDVYDNVTYLASLGTTFQS
jgi:flotillin